MHSVDKVLPAAARSCPKLCVVTDMVVNSSLLALCPYEQGLGGRY